MADTATLAKPSHSYAAAAIARNSALYLIALTSIPILYRWHPLSVLLGVPVLGLAMYSATIVMHDCVHGTLFASALANHLVGIAAGAVSGIEFNAFSRLHRRHHQSTGRPDDPQGPDYFIAATASRVAILWHLLRPLLGYNLFKLGQVFIAPKPASSFGGRGLVWLLVVQIAAAAIASSGFHSWWLAFLPAASAATFGLFFAQLRGFAEHVTMPGILAVGFVRSHRPSAIDRIFLYDLNFNFHREHHLFPAVPSCHLPELSRQLADRAPEGPTSAPSMFATIASRIAAGRPIRSRMSAAT